MNLRYIGLGAVIIIVSVAWIFIDLTPNLSSVNTASGLVLLQIGFILSILSFFVPYLLIPIGFTIFTLGLFLEPDFRISKTVLQNFSPRTQRSQGRS